MQGTCLGCFHLIPSGPLNLEDALSHLLQLIRSIQILLHTLLLFFFLGCLDLQQHEQSPHSKQKSELETPLVLEEIEGLQKEQLSLSL